MKCKECRKRIVFDHYWGSTGSGTNGNLHLVFRCDCGFHMVPFDLIQVSSGKGLLSSGKIRHWKVDGNLSNGKKLSKEGQKIFHTQGEKAYDRWTKEVFLPLMDAALKKMRANTVKARP